MDDENFDELTIQRVTESDLEDILKFLSKDFLKNEPLNRSIELGEDDAIVLFKGENFYFIFFISDTI